MDFLSDFLIRDRDWDEDDWLFGDDDDEYYDDDDEYLDDDVYAEEEDEYDWFACDD